MSSFIACGVCGIEKKEQYTCPKCQFRYCSIRCYRAEKHAECSESFYQEHVKRELSGQKFDQTANTEEYKEKMQKFLNGDWSGIEEEGEPLDSDDDLEPGNEETWEKEHDEGLKKTVQGTIDDYELDDGEIERRMVALGLSDDIDELLNSLTPEEREAFRQLAGEMQEEELGLNQSCFSGAS